jgi:hypothetical protein
VTTGGSCFVHTSMNAIAEIDLVKTWCHPIGRKINQPMQTLRPAGQFISMRSRRATDASDDDGASADRTVTTATELGKESRT